jgi:hypothetical protein
VVPDLSGFPAEVSTGAAITRGIAGASILGVGWVADDEVADDLHGVSPSPPCSSGSKREVHPGPASRGGDLLLGARHLASHCFGQAQSERLVPSNTTFSVPARTSITNMHPQVGRAGPVLWSVLAGWLLLDVLISP